MVAIFPERLARSFGEQIRIVKMPFDFPGNDLSMAWHPRVHSAEAHVWPRRIMGECNR